MEYSDIVDLLQTAATNMPLTVAFGHGRADDFNVWQKTYPAIWCDPIRVTPSQEDGINTIEARLELVCFAKASPDNNRVVQASTYNEAQAILSQYLTVLYEQADVLAISKQSFEPLLKSPVGGDNTSASRITALITLPNRYDC
jgi:hypothetical protein